MDACVHLWNSACMHTFLTTYVGRFITFHLFTFLHPCTQQLKHMSAINRNNKDTLVSWELSIPADKHNKLLFTLIFNQQKAGLFKNKKWQQVYIYLCSNCHLLITQNLHCIHICSCPLCWCIDHFCKLLAGRIHQCLKLWNRRLADFTTWSKQPKWYKFKQRKEE